LGQLFTLLKRVSSSTTSLLTSAAEQITSIQVKIILQLYLLLHLACVEVSCHHIVFCSLSPGEQPPSSMAPTILQSVSQQKTLVIGGSGGSMITAAMALVSWSQTPFEVIGVVNVHFCLSKVSNVNHLHG